MAASSAAEAAEAERSARVRRRTTRLRGLVALLAVLLLVSATTTVDAVRARRAAEQRRDTALSREIAREAVAVLFLLPAPTRLDGLIGPVAFRPPPAAACPSVPGRARKPF